MLKLMPSVVEEIFYLVVPVRRKMCGRRAATFSSIVEAGALVDMVMIIVFFLDSLIWRGRACSFSQFAKSCAGSA